MLFRSVLRSLHSPRTHSIRTFPVGIRLSRRQFVAGRIWLKDNQENADLSTKDRESSSVNSQSNHPQSKKKSQNFQDAPPADDSSIVNQSTSKDQSNLATEEKPNTVASAVESTTSKLPQSPIKSLPDLTQGIPSTLDDEYPGKNHQSSLNLTDSAYSSGEGAGRSRGTLPDSAYISSSEKRLSRVANYCYGAIFLLSFAATIYLGRNWDSKEEEDKNPGAPSGWTVGLMWKRAKARVGERLNYYNEPAFQKLLPDMEPMFERPYTLILSLEDLLICSEWSREHGWRLAKRPGVDYFLRYLSQYYELVVFTDQPSQFAEPVIRKLDPYHIIMWPLFREATLYENGEYIKDLSYLNRDLSKVIIIDTDEAHVKKQPENAIILKPWKGDAKDKELISLIPFLEYIHTMSYTDVRKALKSFEGKHIPTEFARREAISRQEFLKQLELEKKKLPKVSGIGLIGQALGIKPQPLMMDPLDQSPGEAFLQGKMLQDQARERGQRNYELLEKEIRENGEKWLKEEAAMEEKAKEESMKAMKSGLIGWFNFGQNENPS